MIRLLASFLLLLALALSPLAQEAPAVPPAAAPAPAPEKASSPAPQPATPAAPAAPAQPAPQSAAPSPEQAPQPPNEANVFNAAVISYNDNLFERAEREFREFRNAYPTSTNLANAVVYQGLSLYRQNKFADTLNFFRPLVADTNVTLLSGSKDRFRYWMGMSSSKLADYPGAITSFSELVQEHPQSSLVPNALYFTGNSWRMLGNVKKAIELFTSPEGAFVQVAAKEPNHTYVIQSHLLLAEMLIAQNDFQKAQGVLEKVADHNLPPELQWKRLFLLARIALAQKDIKAAGINITNLLTLTTNAGLLTLEYQGLALQGDLLRQENKIEEASAIYEKNVANKLIPVEERWLALMNTVSIKLELKKREEAIGLLKNFNAESNDKPYNDELLATLGNLELQDYYGDAPQLQLLRPGQGAKNEKLLSSFRSYTNLVTTFPKSKFLPKASLNLGLCYWELNRPDQAMSSLSNAIATLPSSQDNAFARVKLAEVQFYQKEFSNTAQTLAAYMESYANDAHIPSTLQEQALHLQLCSAIENRNEELAKSSMASALTKYPKSPFTERDLIYLGNYLCTVGKPADARTQFQECLHRFPESSRATEVSWSMARTWLYEKKYPEAIKAYQTWLETHPKDSTLYPLAEFELAWTYAQSGENELALSHFSLFLNSHSEGTQAILARKWIADFYYNQKDFFLAEKNYQLIFEQPNRLTSLDPLVLDARMMAARSAFARSSNKDANKHLLGLVNLLLSKQVVSGDLLDEALLLLGDTLTSEVSFSEDPQAKLTRFAEAINAYSRIPETNRLGAVAMGRIANCHFQLAGENPPDTNRISQAILFYNRAMTAPQASVETRSMAELGLATLYQYLSGLDSLSQSAPSEKLKNALDHYLNVFQGKYVESNEYDPFCVQRAGMEVARIQEEQKQWSQALSTYERLLKLVPSLEPLLKLKMEYVREHIAPDEEPAATPATP